MPPEPTVKGVLGLVVAGFGARCRHGSTAPGNSGAIVLRGCLDWPPVCSGGAYRMNGPPLVIYGSLRRWPPERFRATLQGYFLPASIIGMAGYWAAGLWTAQVDRYFLLSLPAVLLAIAFGRMINTRLETQRFLSVVHAGLLASGAGLFIQVMVRWT
jgi:hypothetical protein